MLCKHCNTEKPADGFYASAKSKCKDCIKAAVTAHRQANLEKIRQYDRERAKNPHRIANAAEQTKRWRSEDGRRCVAHSQVARAIRSGVIEKEPCCVCGSENSLAHHESYDRPLEVVWYCQPHHKARHKEMALKGIEP